jgi:uncharacterized protein (TIGR01777 family)
VKVGIIGASGLVGGAICSALEKAGHSWIGFSRSPKGREGEWRALEDGFAGLDAVVNVAGDSIDKRWTDENKKKFYQSRVGVTDQVVAQLARLAPAERPRVFVNASAVGYYGDQGDRVLDESSPAGTGYLAELCEQWEEAAWKAEELEVRVVCGRIGVVLGSEASAWQRMKLIFSLGAGGRLGSGEQYWPLVHLEDVAGGVLHALEKDTISGPLNLVSECTVTNAEFTKILGSVLRRPTILPAPAFALKLVLGGFAEALLASYRAQPGVLKKTGYQFRYPDLRGLLESLK